MGDERVIDATESQVAELRCEVEELRTANEFLHSLVSHYMSRFQQSDRADEATVRAYGRLSRNL
ncbi:hypothetical protein [Streptomyces lydicamycinicus]|uniref:hypothetical protein n=1 Tax=Streptomyces lydicamycinicus TaxID=1546107 RepID=UPI003C2D9871